MTHPNLLRVLDVLKGSTGEDGNVYAEEEGAVFWRYGVRFVISPPKSEGDPVSYSDSVARTLYCALREYLMYIKGIERAT